MLSITTAFLKGNLGSIDYAHKMYPRYDKPGCPPLVKLEYSLRDFIEA